MARRGEGRALLLCDFDKTLTDCDAGERLVGELAPELAPQLASLQMPNNFVPLTNAVRAFVSSAIAIEPQTMAG